MIKAINQMIKFLSNNYINEKCLFELSEESAQSERLYDFMPYDFNNLFLLTGNTGNITVWFKDIYSQYTSREIDTIIIQNTNIKNMTVKYLNSENVETTIYELEDNESSEIRILLPAKIQTSKIIFEITDIIDGDNISIGQLRVCKHIIDLKATTQTKVQNSGQDGTIRTYNGRLIKWTDYNKWSASVQITNMSKTQYDLLKLFVIADGFITIIPFPDFEIKDVYECGVSLKDFNYDINRWSGLYQLTLNLEAQENACY